MRTLYWGKFHHHVSVHGGSIYSGGSRSESDFVFLV